MNPSRPRRPLQRTRQYDIWQEYRSDTIGPYQLVIQLVDSLSDETGTMMLRAGYRKDGDMRPSAPMFEATHWVDVLTAAIADDEMFTDELVDRIAAACADRMAK